MLAASPSAVAAVVVVRVSEVIVEATVPKALILLTIEGSNNLTGRSTT